VGVASYLNNRSLGINSLLSKEHSMNFGELFSFDKMITPVIIRVIYILGLIANAIAALVALIGSFTTGSATGILVGLIAAAAILVLGSLMIRVYCELLILAFKIYDELKAIRTGTPPPGHVSGFPVIPAPGTPHSPGSPHAQG
jgi:hypothetical protein